MKRFAHRGTLESNGLAPEPIFARAQSTEAQYRGEDVGFVTHTSRSELSGLSGNAEAASSLASQSANSTRLVGSQAPLPRPKHDVEMTEL